MKFIITLFIFQQFTSTFASNCFKMINNEAIFSLDSLIGVEFNFTSKDDTKYFFRFCQPTTQCPSITNSFVVIQNDNNTCTSLTNITNSFADNFKPLDDDDLSKGIRIPLSGGQYNVSTQFIVYCNQDEPSFLTQSINFNSDTYTIIGESQYGCPLLLMSSISQLFLNNIIIVAIFGIIVGFFECLYGKRLLQPTLFVVGYLCGFLFSLLVFSELLESSTNSFYLWIAMMISVLFGAFVGSVAMQLHKLGIILVGVGLGVVISFLLWNAVIVHITTSIYLLYTLMVILSLGCSYLSWKIFDHVIIFSTSFMGSYLAWRCLSLIIGGFPSEMQLSQQIYNGHIQEVPNSFYLYFVAIIVFAAFGIYYQYKEWHKGVTTISELYHEKIDKSRQSHDNYVELQDLPDTILQTEQPIIGIGDNLNKN